MAALYDLLVDLVRAFGLLTRVPTPARAYSGFDGRYDRAARTFPLVGAMLGLGGGVVVAGLTAVGTAPSVAAIVGIAVVVALTGALHEDGLADMADGLGGRTVDRRLSIMRDSSIGTYGALALAFALLIRTGIVAEFAPQAGRTIAALAFVHGISRAAMVWLWWDTPPARTDGAAASSGRPTRDTVRATLAFATVLATISVIALNLGPVLLALVLSGTVALAFRHFAMGALGGHTGDVLGAIAVAVECAALLGLAVGLGAADMVGR